MFRLAQSVWCALALTQAPSASRKEKSHVCDTLYLLVVLVVRRRIHDMRVAIAADHPARTRLAAAGVSSVRGRGIRGMAGTVLVPVDDLS